MESPKQISKTTKNQNNSSDGPLDLSELAKALIQTPEAKEMLKQSGAMRFEDLIGKDGLVAQMLRPLMEQMMEAELTEHLGYEKHQVSGYGSGNNRNGHYPRSLRSSDGNFSLDVPKDRNGEFSPRIITSYKQVSSELEQKIIALYALGTSTKDIAEFIYDTYGVEISEGFVSQVTDAVLKLTQEWQSRPLQAVYAIWYLDAIYVKCREGNRVTTKPSMW